MKKNDNYLDKKPILKSSLTYSVSEDNIVTLEIENKGFMNKLAQKLFQGGAGALLEAITHDFHSIKEHGKTAKHRNNRRQNLHTKPLPFCYFILRSTAYFNYKYFSDTCQL